MRALPLLLLIATLAACRGEQSAPETPAPAAPAPAPDQPAEDVPPANAPPAESPPAASPPAAATPAGGAMPAPGAIGYAGFGPAPFGASEEEVRMAWGADLGEGKPSEPGGCYYLFPQPRPQSGFRLGFMFEGGKFVRLDVDAAEIEAPGGGRVGMGADEIRRLYGARVEEMPHKYVEGAKYLSVPDPAGGRGVLLFDTDANGRVSAWRVGVPPQVYYVEGCG
ncbi:hypothetical protein [Vulcaniibacterium tengchongense]|uniref:Lectin n=1 Tax=Vulcaniibacterium tengchongense TaxID=1273429 RepID=A0A3N4VIV0_9GAMM|nr:hypothetical protein [Vulcaniibacterium tengchongense]RPE79639.1 hypothetical protein EDC50_1462 [Vulcaniibacterium tengchongense]